MTSTPMFNSWLPYARANARTRLRLFCFPYAGGSASIFRMWSAMLPPEIEVCAVQLPGRENRVRELPLTQLNLLIQVLTEAFLPYLNMPFAFFGHSMGALVSFELARQLRRQNYPTPLHLFVSAHRAPQIRNFSPPIHQLPETLFVEKLRLLNGTASEVLEDDELMQLLQPTLRADFAICETYSYTTEDPLVCPISAFGGLYDDEVSYNDLAAWHEQTSSLFTLHILPGNHFFLHNLREPLLGAISKDLALHISQIVRNPHS